MYTYTFICMYVYICICTNTCMHKYTCTHIHTRNYKHNVCNRSGKYCFVCVYVCIRMFVRVCLSAQVLILQECMCLFAYQFVLTYAWVKINLYKSNFTTSFQNMYFKKDRMKRHYCHQSKGLDYTSGVCVCVRARVRACM